MDFFISANNQAVKFTSRPSSNFMYHTNGASKVKPDMTTIFVLIGCSIGALFLAILLGLFLAFQIK